MDEWVQVVQVPAIGESNAVDTTGAGDLFASGFLYGLVKGLPLEECCKVGACSGGSVTRALGGEVRPENWQWMYKQMHARGLLGLVQKCFQMLFCFQLDVRMVHVQADE